MHLNLIFTFTYHHQKNYGKTRNIFKQTCIYKILEKMWEQRFWTLSWAMRKTDEWVASTKNILCNKGNCQKNED